jgi:hypothetical protein
MGILSLILGLAGLGSSIWKATTDSQNAEKKNAYDNDVENTQRAASINGQAQNRREALTRAIGANYPYGPQGTYLGPNQPNYNPNYAASEVGGAARSLGAINWDRVFNGKGAPVGGASPVDGASPVS